jgi:hypothetical protein
VTDARFKSIFNNLAQRQLVVPWLENALLSDSWPESYNISIDSGEYYGKGDGYFHPSTHSLMGARELYYRFHPDHRDKIIPERKSLQSHMTLAMGSALHGVIQTQFQMAGMLSPENTELEYVNKEHHVRGRIDFVLDPHPSGEKVLVELKTQNSFAFKKQDTIKESWDAQMSLAMDNTGFDYGILLVMESGWPYSFKEFRVPRNDKLLSEIYTKFDFVRSCISMNTPPKHCCVLNSKEMENCPARFSCWLKDEVES